jgi:hypothetical protein
MVLKRPVNIARSGKIIGEFSSSDLGAMMESGELLPGDLCYLEEENLWVPLRDYLEASSLPKFQPPPAAAGEEEKEEAPNFMLFLSSPTMIVLGWVAFLLACGAIVGAGVWIFSLQKDLARAEAEAKGLQHRLQSQEQEYRELLSERESGADQGIVRGKVILQSENGEPILMPDFVLRLYHRKTVEAHLRERQAELAEFEKTGNTANLAEVLNTLPPPLLETASNAIGEYELELPDDGDYVIHSSMSVPREGTPRILLWFLGCSKNDPLGLPVNITDWNRVGNYKSELMIVPGR